MKLPYAGAAYNSFKPRPLRGLGSMAISESAKAAKRSGLTQALEAMDSSQLLTKAFLALALACAFAVVILLNIAGAGFLARLLVYAFLAGLLTSGIAATLSFRPGSPKALRQVSIAAFGVYASTAAAVVLWVLVAKPPFG